jgi:hypothetical protein
MISKLTEIAAALARGAKNCGKQWSLGESMEVKVP